MLPRGRRGCWTQTAAVPRRLRQRARREQSDDPTDVAPRGIEGGSTYRLAALHHRANGPFGPGPARCPPAYGSSPARVLRPKDPNKVTLRRWADSAPQSIRPSTAPACALFVPTPSSASASVPSDMEPVCRPSAGQSANWRSLPRSVPGPAVADLVLRAPGSASCAQCRATRSGGCTAGCSQLCSPQRQRPGRSPNPTPSTTRLVPSL